MKKTAILLITFTFLISGCATLAGKEANVCENNHCEVVATTAQKHALLGKLYTLLKNNLDRDIDFYPTEPEKREQLKRGFGFYLQGGPIPGWATVHSIKFTDILYIDRDNFEIKFKVDPTITWNGTPVFSTSTEGTLTVKDNNQIKYSSTYFVSWMVVGTSMWKHEMLFDYIDLDKSVLGSFYSIAGGGPLCAGSGDGYALARFPVGVQEEQQATVIAVKPKKPGSAALQPPALAYNVSLGDASGKQLLEGGSVAVLRVEVANNGEDSATDVQIILSGHAELVSYLGERHVLGNIKSGEKKVVVLKAALPAKIQSGEARVDVEIKEGKGYSPGDRKSVRVALQAASVEETVEVISKLPKLTFTTGLRDQNNNRILDGGEEIILNVTINNSGNGVAKDVQVMLSGNKDLVGLLGEKKFVGEMKPGEKKTVEFKTILPLQISSETADLRIEVIDGQRLSPSQRKTLQIAMRPAETVETVEVISEVNVDDIPTRIKGYNREDAVALIIGIGKYREEKIPPVKYAVRDAEVVAKYFEHLGGIPKTNIQLLVDEKASKSDIQAYVEEWLPRRVNENSTIFIFYSGHGAPDLQGKEAYLVPYEGRPDFPSQLYPLQSLYDSLEKLRAKQVVVMLDSCFSGAKGRSVSREGARPLVMNMEKTFSGSSKVIVIAGAAGSQISSDYDRARHGLFTYYLLRGLRGEADGKKSGTIELGELFDYVKRNVSEKASLELNRDQSPVLLPVGLKDLRIPIARTK